MLEQYGIDLTSSYFSHIQKNPIYCGIYKDVRGFCEPYITEAQHEALCDWSNSFRQAVHTDKYIFRRMIRCARCGLLMQPTTVDGRVYYRCSSRYTKHRCDLGATIRQERIEQFLLQSIRPAFDAYKYRVTVDQTETDNSERIERLREKLKRLTDLYIDGAISKDEYDRRRTSYNAEIDRLEPHRTVDMSEMENLLNQPWEMLYNELDSADAKASFWRSMIKTVYFDGTDLSIDFI